MRLARPARLDRLGEARAILGEQPGSGAAPTRAANRVAGGIPLLDDQSLSSDWRD